MANITNQLFGGNWTEQKLEILRNYLNSYNTVLKKQPFTRIYIDAFAGTGYRQDRKLKDFNIFEELRENSSEEFLKGSAALALESNPSFHKYIFIENDHNKSNELEKLREKHPDKELDIIKSDANTFIQSYCEDTDWRSTRAVLFLDPFATEVQWTTIEAIAKTQCIDVWILFPLMAVNRLLAKDPDKIFYDRLNLILGNQDWFEHFYKTQTLDDIFGRDIDIIKKACDFESIGNYYKSRLKTIFSGVSESTKMFCNSRKSPLFQFFFAAGNPKGVQIALRIAEHLMRNI